MIAAAAAAAATMRWGARISGGACVARQGFAGPAARRWANRSARRDLLLRVGPYTLFRLLVGRLMPVASESKWGRRAQYGGER